MTEEASIEFRLNMIDATRSYLLDEINHHDLMSKKNKETGKYLNDVKNLLILVSAVTGCLSISAFSLLSCWYYKVCNRNKDLCNHCRT